EPRHAHQQRVATHEQREQHVLDHVLLPHDELVQLRADPVRAILHPLRERNVVRRLERDRFGLVLLYGECHGLALPGSKWLALLPTTCLSGSIRFTATATAGARRLPQVLDPDRFLYGEATFMKRNRMRSSTPPHREPTFRHTDSQARTASPSPSPSPSP